MSEVRASVVAGGVAPDGEPWTLHYAPEGERGYPHHLALFVNGRERGSRSGFDVPGTTEIGFGGGLTPGEGNYYLYGITSSRIRTVRAESQDEARRSEASTSALPEDATGDGDALRIFVLVRSAVDDVTALVGLDQAGREAQRSPLMGPPARS